MSLDDDLMEELRQEQEWYARRIGERRRRTDEADGYFQPAEDDMADLKDAPAVKIEINCTCGRVLEAATYIDNGLIKLVVPVCQCAERRER